ncbi:MAG: hypothetical protein JXR18_10040 [Neptuniibacter sp.]
MSAEHSPISHHETEAILRGEDPTDLLAAAAAGNPDVQNDNNCHFGVVIGNNDAAKLDGSFYIAFEKNNVTYIQVSPLIPTYLIKPEGYFISAQAITPDEEIREQLNKYFQARKTCVSVDLYLERIETS